ncbi:putative pyridoxal reductase [[Candida] jaroonii]|uniref:Pyridoxal reductase n=1 Tax=[Candida] jaroonii TaxID=467808 RepID=A0ACA9YDC7_9ASCO|nr:putative pyridoxal reductase [[Candida] jaroonii]
MVKQVPMQGLGYGTLSLSINRRSPEIKSEVELMKYAYDKGVRVFNGANFYSMGGLSNFDFFVEFCKAYPEAAKEIVVTYKGNFDFTVMQPVGTKEACELVVNEVQEALKSLTVKPKVVVVIGRVDPNIPIEETVGYYLPYIESGVIDGYGISECGVSTIEKASKVAPISCIEVEFSMTYQHIIKLGILKAASDRNVAILAYSPLSRGLLTDFAAGQDDFLGALPDTDMRKIMGMDRFQREHFDKNIGFIKELYQYAKSKNTTLESLAITYLLELSGLENFEGIDKVSNVIPIPSATKTSRIDSNLPGKLSKEDLFELQKKLNSFEASGGRYTPQMEGQLNL